MNRHLLATALALAISAGSADAQTPTPIDPAWCCERCDIACTWLLFDSRKQYAGFEALRSSWWLAATHGQHDHRRGS